VGTAHDGGDVHAEPSCPRCGSGLREPGLWSSAWQCPRHGSVDPYTVMEHSGAEALAHVVERATVPVWLLNPGPSGWLCSGVGFAGDQRTGARATVTAMCGPGPLGGAADLMVVAEEPGVGLGARYAGMAEMDPGDTVGSQQPDAKILAAGHLTPLWSVPSAPDRAVFVGEAKAAWLWLLVWPAAAGVMAYDDPVLVDVREKPDLDLGFGSVTPRLVEPPTDPPAA
jgi:hypothetical protein